MFRLIRINGQFKSLHEAVILQAAHALVEIALQLGRLYTAVE